MGTSPQDVFDPKTDSIAFIIDDAMQAYRDRALKATSASGSSEIWRMEIIINMTKRLEEQFKKQNQKALTDEQIKILQQKCIQHFDRQKEKELLKKFFLTTLLIVSLKYSALLAAKKRTLKQKLKSKLRAAYMRWKKRKILKQKEEEKEKIAAESSENKEMSPEEKEKKEKQYQDELRMLWGSLFATSRPSTDSQEFAAAFSAEYFGDTVRDEINSLHEDLGIELSPEEKLQFNNEIEQFKSALFEIDVNLANTNTSDPSMMSDIYNRFSQHVLSPLDQFRKNAMDLAGKAHSNVNDARNKIAERFEKITQGLMGWARGEPGVSAQSTATLEIDPARIEAGRKAAEAQKEFEGSRYAAGASGTNSVRDVANAAAADVESAQQPSVRKSKLNQIPKPTPGS